jgi:hypothetical protein
VKIETVSTGFVPALLKGNSNQLGFQNFTAVPADQQDKPVGDVITNDIGINDGTYKAGWRGAVAENRIQVQPYADQAGCQFSFRVWIWSEATWPGQTGYGAVWVPSFVAEFSCVSGQTCGVTNQGPATTVNPYLLSDTCFPADTITLVQGMVGLTGLVNSTGPGTNLPAYALMEILGARFVTFDFQQSSDEVGMNALWRFC